MITKKLSVLAVSIFFALNSTTFGAWLWWTNGAGNRSWSDGGNWTANPTSGDDVVIGKDSLTGPIIEDGVTGYGNWVHLTDSTPSGSVLTITGGTMNVSDHFFIGQNWGAGNKGTLEMSGGTVNTTLLLVGGDTDGGGGEGIVNISGGTINVSWLLAIAGGYSGTNGNGIGRINLTGGLINAVGGGGFVMSPKGSMDIAGGSLKLAGNITNITGYGNVTAYNGTGTFVYSYDVQSNVTTITALPEPATIALLAVGFAGFLIRNRVSN